MASSGEIEFVYFDVGNVLLSFDPECACRNLATLVGGSPGEARDAVYRSGLQNRFEHGQVSPEDFAAAICGVFNIPLTDNLVAKILDAVSDMFTPIDLMAEAVRQVTASGRGVGVLSNTCRAHWEWIGRQQYAVLEGLSEIAILSYEVGAMKPDQRMYIAAENAAGTRSERILFVDDRSENVETAVMRGWNAAQCFGGHQAIAVLQSYGVLT